jgi:hypothetical protein
LLKVSYLFSSHFQNISQEIHCKMSTNNSMNLCDENLKEQGLEKPPLMKYVKSLTVDSDGKPVLKDGKHWEYVLEESTEESRAKYFAAQALNELTQSK